MSAGAKGGAKAEILRQGLGVRRLPRPCRRRVERVNILASEFGAGESFADYLTHGQRKAASGCVLAIVVVTRRGC
jgi:hypothetical protein